MPFAAPFSVFQGSIPLFLLIIVRYLPLRAAHIRTWVTSPRCPSNQKYKNRLKWCYSRSSSLFADEILLDSYCVCDLFSGFSAILSSMMKRETGSKTLRSERVLSRGHPNFNGNQLKLGLGCSKTEYLYSVDRDVFT